MLLFLSLEQNVTAGHKITLRIRIVLEICRGGERKKPSDLQCFISAGLLHIQLTFLEQFFLKNLIIADFTPFRPLVFHGATVSSSVWVTLTLLVPLPFLGGHFLSTFFFRVASTFTLSWEQSVLHFP